jgi:LmbE family N-acetylglucosaminyl deacetylase
MATNVRRPPWPAARSALGHPPTDAPRRAPPQAREVLAVCAHPDDESFGLGAVLAAFAGQGTSVRVLCLTHGEASTLGNASRPLGEVRAEDLRAAAEALGAQGVDLLSYPDGHLADVPLDELVKAVEDATQGADLLLSFDEGGVSGHPDHCRATEAALVSGARRHVGVLGWALPERVANGLNAELGTGFVGRAPGEVDFVVDVDRARQSAAIHCHATQSTGNPVLARRLELLEGKEHLRWLHRPGQGADEQS